MRKIITCSLILALIIACGDDEEPNPETELLIYSEPPTDTLDVTSQYQYIFDTMVYEGARRGVDLVIENVKVVYDSAMEAGLCSDHIFTAQESDSTKYILLNPYTECIHNYYTMEQIILHGLGILVLGREENTETLPNGDPKSIMSHDNILMYSGCIYQIGTVEECNLIYRREYYMDELFHENVPVPSWGQ
jgi:hypothetical protein